MKRKLEGYLYGLIHPNKVHQSYRHGIPLPSTFGGEIEKVSLTEALSFSWAFIILKSMLQIAVLYAFASSFEGLTIPIEGEMELALPTTKVSSYLFMLGTLIFNVIFFPVFKLIAILIWKMILSLYAYLLQTEDDEEEIAEQILTVSLSSYFLELVPFIGELFQQLGQIVLMYSGCRRNLGASRTLSVIIILTPYFLVFSVLCVISLLVTILFI